MINPASRIAKEDPGVIGSAKEIKLQSSGQDLNEKDIYARSSICCFALVF